MMVSGHSWKFRCQKMAQLWCEADFEVKMHKTPAPAFRSTFGGSDVEKVSDMSLIVS